MKVQVGAYWYTVKISPRVPAGKAGLCVWATKEILISPQVDPADRLEVLGHEYHEAYLMHYPPATGKEASCDLFAALFKQLVESLGAARNLSTLQGLVPERLPVAHDQEPGDESASSGGLVYDSADVAPVHGEEDWLGEKSTAPVKVDIQSWRKEPGRVEPGRMLDTRYCPGCSRPVPGPLVIDLRQEDPHFGPVLFRTIHCECLPGLWHWFEPAGAKWKPALETGSLEPRPRKTTDPRLIAQWVAQYPHAAPQAS